MAAPRSYALSSLWANHYKGGIDWEWGKTFLCYRCFLPTDEHPSVEPANAVCECEFKVIRPNICASRPYTICHHDLFLSDPSCDRGFVSLLVGQMRFGAECGSAFSGISIG